MLRLSSYGIITSLFFFISSQYFNYAYADGNDIAPIAEVVSTIGKASILRSGDKLSVQKGMKLFGSDQLVTTKGAVTKIVFADGSNFVVMPDSSVEIENYWTEAQGSKTILNSTLNLVRGKARFFFKPRDGGVNGVVKTANAVMSVRGTSFFVDNTSDKNNSEKNTQLVVLTGSVEIFNPKTPEKIKLAKENEVVSVTEEEIPTEPMVAPQQIVASLAQEAAAIPDKSPDGSVIPPELELPPPVIPSVFNGEKKVKNTPFITQKGTLIKQIITPQYMVVPLGAALATRASVACDGKSLDKLRQAAQNLDPETVAIGRELAQCDGLFNESIFWLGFYHLAIGEAQKAIDASKFAKQDNTPLSTKSEQEKLVQKALDLNSMEALEQLKKKNPNIDKDYELSLTVARTLTRIGKFDDAVTWYNKLDSINKLQGNINTKIEYAYMLLLSQKYSVAELVLTDLLNENLNDSQKYAINKAIEYINRAQIKQSKAQDNVLQLNAFTSDDYDDLANRKFGASWTSNLVDLKITTGKTFGKNPTPFIANSSTNSGSDWSERTSELIAGKRIELSSGMKLKGSIGYFEHNGIGTLEFATGGSYVFSNNIGLGAALERTPLIQKYNLDKSSRNWNATTMALQAWYLELLANKPAIYASFNTFQTQEFDPSIRISGGARIPVHRGQKIKDHVFITATAMIAQFSQNIPQFFSPKTDKNFSVGVESRQSIYRWLDIGLDGDYGFMRREKGEIVSTSTTAITTPVATTTTPYNLLKSKLRESYTQGNSWLISPKIFFNIGAKYEIALSGKFSQESSPESDKTWSDSMLNLNINWFYNR